jgi:phosphoribosyl-ATP pyrophosphohydrolase
MTDAIARLYAAVLKARDNDPSFSRTARLMQGGTKKMAKKLGEEALEVGIEALAGDRTGLVQESADVIYHLCVLWAAAGITPDEIIGEIERRERLYGIAEKLPKGAGLQPPRRPLHDDAPPPMRKIR